MTSFKDLSPNQLKELETIFGNLYNNIEESINRSDFPTTEEQKAIALMYSLLISKMISHQKSIKDRIARIDFDKEEELADVWTYVVSLQLSMAISAGEDGLEITDRLYDRISRLDNQTIKNIYGTLLISTESIFALLKRLNPNISGIEIEYEYIH